jgi:hypothetical protein
MTHSPLLPGLATTISRPTGMGPGAGPGVPGTPVRGLAAGFWDQARTGPGTRTVIGTRRTHAGGRPVVIL